MTTEPRTVEYIQEQIANVAGASVRKMFGEYAIFLDGKTVALICNDQLFVKPTEAGRMLAPSAQEASAYPGAKPSLHIDAEFWEDSDWLSNLILTTAAALPAPKPKRQKIK